MELKEATNFLLIKEYIQKRNHSLHYFENLIIRDCLKYYLEPQFFFFLMDKKDLSCSFLQEQYKDYLKNYKTCSVQVARCSDDGNIWIRKKEIVGWKENKKYKQEREVTEWDACYGDVWNFFPNGLVKNHDYKILTTDESIILVLFYKKMQFSQTKENEGKIIQYAYQLSCQKTCDIIYDKFDEISYSFFNNQETMNQLGIEEYFRWLRYYKEQEEELIKKLVI